MFSIFLTLALALSTPCATEDASNCYWFASEQGNGIGVSFLDIQGTAYYTSK